MSKINMMRIGTKIDELFKGHIDLSDMTNPAESIFKTRSLAALSLMMKCGLDVSTSSAQITDGFHDMGIDAIYLDEAQKQLFLVQSKWRSNGQGSVSHAEMLVFIDGIKKVLDSDIAGANERVKAKKNDIEISLENMGYQIHAVFIHTGNQALPIFTKKALDDFLSTVNDEVATLVVFSEILYQDIYTYLATGNDSDDIKLDDVIISNWGKSSRPYVAYYGTIKAASIGEWYTKYGNRLFAKNIRYYKGSTDVNEGIKRVLLQEPENFFYYNNGIKLLCKSIHRKAMKATTNEIGLFCLDGVSLVNGAQTAGSIGSVFAENTEVVSRANVLVQIIDLSNAPDEASTQITKLSNTQNRIENRDFASLDPNQERIRKELSFSHFSYLYKGGDTITDPMSQITFDEAIVALACSYDLSYATTAKSNVGALSEDISKAPYKVLMNDKTNSFLVLNSTMIVRRVDKELQTKKVILTGRERLVAIHGNRFIAYLILKELKKDFDFSGGCIPEDSLNTRVAEAVNRYLPSIIRVVNESYSDSYPANIFKNVTKCKDIEDIL